MKQVAVLGLGIIGIAWARNLHADGLEVRGWNRTAKEFPFFQREIVKAIDQAEAIFLVVADPPAVESILEQITPHLRRGQLVIQSSTISADWTRKFAQRVEDAGAKFLEAPFTGSKPAAEARKTVFYLGGPGDLVEMARPLLSRLSSHQLHVGPVGSASSLKLAMNLNLATMAQALAESLTLARAEGIADEKYFEALHLNVGRSGLSDLKEPKLKADDFAPQFSLKHMDKDLRLALETAGKSDLPVAKALKAFYAEAMHAGWGDDDFISGIRLLSKTAKSQAA